VGQGGKGWGLGACPRAAQPGVATWLSCSWPVGPASPRAHPGWGIVVDTPDNVLYTDLKQVWQIGADGSKTIIVPDVHSHELYLDSRGVLHAMASTSGTTTNRTSWGTTCGSSSMDASSVSPRGRGSAPRASSAIRPGPILAGRGPRLEASGRQRGGARGGRHANRAEPAGTSAGRDPHPGGRRCPVPRAGG